MSFILSCLEEKTTHYQSWFKVSASNIFKHTLVGCIIFTSIAASMVGFTSPPWWQKTDAIDLLLPVVAERKWCVSCWAEVWRETWFSITPLCSLHNIDNTSDRGGPSAEYQTEGEAEENFSQFMVPIWHQQGVLWLWKTETLESFLGHKLAILKDRST